MGTAYTTYAQKAQADFIYRFCCEHCQKESSPRSFTVHAAAQKNVPGKGTLSMEDQIMLKEQAEKSLKSAIEAKKNFVLKGNYGGEIKGKCEFCGKRQSWEMKSATLLPLWGAFSGLGLGFFIMVFPSAFGYDAGIKATVTIPICLLGGLIVGIVQLVRMKMGTAKSTVKSKPIINWQENLNRF